MRRRMRMRRMRRMRDRNNAMCSTTSMGWQVDDQERCGCGGWERAFAVRGTGLASKAPDLFARRA